MAKKIKPGRTIPGSIGQHGGHGGPDRPLSVTKKYTPRPPHIGPTGIQPGKVVRGR